MATAMLACPSCTVYARLQRSVSTTNCSAIRILALDPLVYTWLAHTGISPWKVVHGRKPHVLPSSGFVHVVLRKLAACSECAMDRLRDCGAQLANCDTTPGKGISGHFIGCEDRISHDGSSTDLLCSISTSSGHALCEEPELRAYKLGKQKCSYNQVELAIRDLIASGGSTDLEVSEAIETPVGPEVDDRLRESCLKFNVRFTIGTRINLYILIVYSTPYGASLSKSKSNNQKSYQWMPVTRSRCRKGCKGPVIRGLQRFGRISKRAGGGSDFRCKEPRHLYIAIDEASTHVCPLYAEVPKFRFLTVAYDAKYQLLGTTVSSAIRVLANNDTPLGAACFKLHCDIIGGWDRPVQPLLSDKALRSRTPFSDISNKKNTWLRACPGARCKVKSSTSVHMQSLQPLSEQPGDDEQCFKAERPGDEEQSSKAERPGDEELEESQDEIMKDSELALDPTQPLAHCNKVSEPKEPSPEFYVQTVAFNPLQYLEQLFTPYQIEYFQKQNPAFLYNFVRYSREMYNKFCRDKSQQITRPTAKRLRIPGSNECGRLHSLAEKAKFQNSCTLEEKPMWDGPECRSYF